MAGAAVPPPPPPAAAPPPAPAQVAPPNAAGRSSTPPDPHGIGVAISSLGLFARRSGKVAFSVIAHLLDHDERVEVMVVGRFLGENGAAAVTNKRVVIVNDREWKPEVETIPFTPGLSVQGWQDDRAATLAFEHAGRQVVIDQIGDRELAQRVAALVRSRCG